MTEAEFTNLTGITLSSSETGDRFTAVEDVAQKDLERQLGYPLDPSSWANLYNETGKTQADCICPDVDNTLDAADAVVGKYRLYDYHPTDRYLSIDPATAIHKVKLIRENITYKTFDISNGETTDDIAIKWVNGSPKVTYYLDLENCTSWAGWREACWRRMKYVQLAVDATWAWGDETSEIPRELQAIHADLIAKQLRGPDLDIQSESRGSHSYTVREPVSLVEKYPALKEFAGPNGLAKRRVM